MIRRHLPGLALGLLSFALAPAVSAQPAPQAPPPGAYQQEDGPPRIESNQRPVYAITGVEVMQSGSLTTVKVRGATSTLGWSDPVIVPLTRGTPSDGMLDVIVVAEPPPEAMSATGLASFETTLLIEQNHPYRGVRVRSATNVVALAQLPGTAQGAPAGEDCQSCVGRTLGEAAAAGAIARSALPKGTRVLGPADPFPDVDPDPNRLTLLVGDDGKIIEAVWQ